MRGLGERSQLAEVLGRLSTAAIQEGDFVAARAAGQESLDLFRKLGDAEGVAYSLAALGFALLGHGSEAEGERLLEEALEAAKAVGTGAIRAGRSRVWDSPRCGRATIAPRGAASRRPPRS